MKNVQYGTRQITISLKIKETPTSDYAVFTATKTIDFKEQYLLKKYTVTSTGITSTTQTQNETITLNKTDNNITSQLFEPDQNAFVIGRQIQLDPQVAEALNCTGYYLTAGIWQTECQDKTSWAGTNTLNPIIGTAIASPIALDCDIEKCGLSSALLLGKYIVPQKITQFIGPDGKPYTNTTYRHMQKKNLQKCLDKLKELGQLTEKQIEKITGDHINFLIYPSGSKSFVYDAHIAPFEEDGKECTIFYEPGVNNLQGFRCEKNCEKQPQDYLRNPPNGYPFPDPFSTNDSFKKVIEDAIKNNKIENGWSTISFPFPFEKLTIEDIRTLGPPITAATVTAVIVYESIKPIRCAIAGIAAWFTGGGSLLFCAT